ncbi:MAG: 30S ribosomal protein S11 [Verrucomicrobia bacterium]|nr:30S ribosomal protein S11 [Verrucomicrobiota bacterium]
MAKQPATQKKASSPRARKKAGRIVSSGIAHVRATFNNTIVTITDPAGRVISWGNAGKAGLSGSRKSSAFAGTLAAQDAAKAAVAQGMKEVEVNLNGPGSGREAAVRALQAVGLTVTIIRDTTRVAHNGCRPRKRRRA